MGMIKHITLDDLKKMKEFAGVEINGYKKSDIIYRKNDKGGFTHLQKISDKDTGQTYFPEHVVRENVSYKIVLDEINDFLDTEEEQDAFWNNKDEVFMKIGTKMSHKMKGHRTRAPSKKCPVRVNVRKMF